MLGQTALHLASKIGHGKCLKTLLEYGADIHITVSLLSFNGDFGVPTIMQYM